MPRGASLGALDLYLLGVLLVVVFIAQVKLNNGVTSDGALYFAHLRSLVFDHDLQIDAELQFLGLPPRPHHVIPIGPTILWAPLYLLVALGDWIGSRAGLWTRESGVALGSTSAVHSGRVSGVVRDRRRGTRGAAPPAAAGVRRRDRARSPRC